MQHTDARTLILLRHAKSSWKHSGLSDFDRPLNDRGRRNAPEMGRRLRARGLQPDLILSSSAARALATAQLLGAAMDAGADIDLRVAPTLYLADPETILRQIHALEDRLHCVILIAHNPGLSELIEQLAPGSLDNLPTCGYAEFRFDAESWGLAETDCATLVALDYPKNTQPPAA